MGESGTWRGGRNGARKQKEKLSHAYRKRVKGTLGVSVHPVDRMIFSVPVKKAEEKEHACSTSQESSKTSLTNFQSVFPPSSSPSLLSFSFSFSFCQSLLYTLLHSLSLSLSLSLFLSAWSSTLALVLTAIKSQFYTGGYPKLIASIRGAPLKWTPRNYVSTAVRGLYEPYKNGTTQPRRRSRTTGEGGRDPVRETGPDHRFGDLVEDEPRDSRGRSSRSNLPFK